MNKKIKIYLQKPWKTTDSAYYKYLRENPPKDVNYVNLHKFSLIQNKTSFNLNNVLKQTIRKIIKNFFPSLPNAHFTKNSSQYDLIHCAHCLSKNKKKWVCDIEYAGQLWAAPLRVGKYSNKKYVSKYVNSPYCKKIIAWTKWCQNDLLSIFPELKNKIELVYPALPLRDVKPKNKGNKDEITLLFSSRRFYFKGGLYALEVIDRLTKKYNHVKGIVISDVPLEILRKYQSNKDIVFLRTVPQKELFNKYYAIADIFIYPSFTDTFGFQITEAMSFGIPVISCSGQSREELIENGKTGFVVKGYGHNSVPADFLTSIQSKKVIDDLTNATEKLIKNPKLITKFSENCINLFKDGKFSISQRNKKLNKIYLEALH